MAELKTKLTGAPVSDFINGLADEQVRRDCWTLIEIMQEAAKAPPQMWGTAIIGFGVYRAVNANGKGNDWMVIGFSPRKQALTLYMLNGFEHSAELLANLGKYTTGGGCLYIKRLADVDLPTLKQMARASVEVVLRRSLTTGA